MSLKNFEQIRSFDNENFVHPWESMKKVGTNSRTFAETAEGIYIYDENGQKLIDGPGGMWCVQIGYGRKEMAEAIADQVHKMPYYSPWNMSASPSALLARKIAERAPADLKHVFFTTCGSTAVDTAIRFVHFYNNVREKPKKKTYHLAGKLLPRQHLPQRNSQRQNTRQGLDGYCLRTGAFPS